MLPEDARAGMAGGARRKPDLRFEALIGPRIRLQPMAMADHHRIAEGIRDARWSSGFPTEGDVLLARLACEFDYLPTAWLIEEGGLVVGGIGITGFEEIGGHPCEVPEIGYGLAREARGRGLCTEAVNVLVGHLLGHADVSGVIATTDPGNEPSRAVLLRSGFLPSGTLDEKDLWLRRPGHDEGGRGAVPG